MPASVAAVAQGIATRLATVSGLRTFAFEPDQLNPPVAFPVLESIDYHGAFGGGDVEMSFTVMLVVGRWVDRMSYATLDAYANHSGAGSIRAAIEGDTTLGGVAQTCVLGSMLRLGTLSQGEADFMSAEFSLKVFG